MSWTAIWNGPSPLFPATVPLFPEPSLFAMMVLSGLSKVVLYLAAFLVLVNINSFPFTWHYKMFRHIWIIQIKFALYRLTLLGKSRETRKKLENAWLDELLPIGSDPWGCGTVLKKFAGPDESDWNMHLSNSSYPKAIDEARLVATIVAFHDFYRLGGWIALGGTHFSFYREIPILSNYEIRTSIASWDEKWLYIVHRFVSFPKKKTGQVQSKDGERSTRNLPSNSAPLSTLHTPANGPDTPSTGKSMLSPATMEILAAARLRTEEPDGATLNCIAISETCFKIGRITVPPSIALAMNGISKPSLDTPYSHKNPPPHWGKVKELLGDPKATREFLAGGWRQVPPADRWWEHALSGPVEETRKANLELLNCLRRSMEGAKVL